MIEIHVFWLIITCVFIVCIVICFLAWLYFKHKNPRYSTESEQLNIQYLREIQLLLHEREEYIADSEEVNFMITDIYQCFEVQKNDTIEVAQSGYIVGDLYGLAWGYSLFLIREGAQIRVLKKAPVIRHGVNNYRCVYLNKNQEEISEDTYIGYNLRPIELPHKTKFFVTEEELLRLKMLAVFISYNQQFQREKFKNNLGISEGA